jgi:hypothetical protein
MSKPAYVDRRGLKIKNIVNTRVLVLRIHTAMTLCMLYIMYYITTNVKIYILIVLIIHPKLVFNTGKNHQYPDNFPYLLICRIC